VADERAERDAEKERPEPAERASSSSPSPHHRRPDAEGLAQDGRIPGLRESREPVTAERQGERERQGFLGRYLPPPSEPSAAAGDNCEGARARQKATQGGGEEAAEGCRRECDGLGPRTTAAAAAASAAAYGAGGRVEEGEAQGCAEKLLEHRATCESEMPAGGEGCNCFVFSEANVDAPNWQRGGEGRGGIPEGRRWKPIDLHPENRRFLWIFFYFGRI
jgi:hypothetical protein